MRPPSLKKIVQSLIVVLVFLVLKRFMRPKEKVGKSDPKIAPKPFSADDLVIKQKTKIVVRKLQVPKCPEIYES